MTEPLDAVERAVRVSLQRRVEEVDTTAPVAERARASMRRRRSRQWTAWLAAAALVVAAVAVGTQLARNSGSEAPLAPGHEATGVPDGWRTEYWDSVRVDVPAAWTWGAGPVVQGGDAVRCGGPDRAEPYVGRPLASSDMCRSVDAAPPDAPYVWFDAPVDVGTVALGDGYIQQTIEVDDTTVTVGTADDALRQEILDSVAVQHFCPSRLDRPPAAAVADIGLDDGAARSLEVCAYQPLAGGAYALVYGETLGPEAARSTEDAVTSAPVISGDCLMPEGGEWVTLRAVVAPGRTRGYVADLNCPAITDSTGRMHRLTPEMERPWADKGLRSSLYAFVAATG